VEEVGAGTNGASGLDAGNNCPKAQEFSVAKSLLLIRDVPIFGATSGDEARHHSCFGRGVEIYNCLLSSPFEDLPPPYHLCSNIGPNTVGLV